ncbi:MAG: GNAT family N-acetyltransferase [Eubacterium sp.]|jgi:Acetyltransferase (GNAT) family.|nr:GNAT family N-acetyltransferase [Eubacterium sp.]
MIRKWKTEDLEAVMELWLMGNTEVHSFISPKYWQQNFSEIQRVVPIARTYVYEHKGKVKGFISAMEGYILGIFVDSDIRKCGMGMVLLDCLKQKEKNLTVTVYEKNVDAVRFFMRQKFRVESELTEDSTGEKQLMMAWNG